MHRLLFACGAVLLCPVTSAIAQTGPEPTIVLTLFGGVTSGHSLWHLDRQPLCVLQRSGSAYNCTPQYDTLELGRDIGTSLVVGASGSYFPSPHLGAQATIFYLGFPFDDLCRGVYLNSDPTQMNQQVCGNIAAASLSASAIGFYGGVVVRVSPRHGISPYLRGGLGIVTYSGGTIEMSGVFDDGSGVLKSRAVYVDDHPKTTSFSIQPAAGFTARLSPGYQFRFELSDAVIPLQRVVGPAGDLGVPVAGSRTYHHLIFSMGLDVVLERKRGRRY